jgi:hypothetical protein
VRGVALVGTLVLSACFSKPDAPGAGEGSDGSVITGCTTYGPWGPAQKLASLATTDDELGAWLSPDRNDIWFSRGNSTFAHHYRSHRPDPSQPFGAVEDIEGLLPTSGGIRKPEPNAEIFISDDGLDAAMDHKQGSVLVVTGHRDAAAGPFEGDDVLYPEGAVQRGDATFSSDQLVVVVAEWNASNAPADLAIATRQDRNHAFPATTKIAELNTNLDDCCASLSADGLTIVWASDRDADFGLFTATRPSRMAMFGPHVAIDTQLPAGSDSTDPVLSRDGLSLIFSSTRTSDYDLYEMQRVCAD